MVTTTRHVAPPTIGIKSNPSALTTSVKNPFVAIIKGPTRLGAMSCDVVTLDSVQFTETDPVSELHYTWKVSRHARIALRSDQRSPTLRLQHLTSGEHVFGLSVTKTQTMMVGSKEKKVSHTARADEFRLTVFPEAAALITFACPALVCTPSAADAYEVKAWPYQQTVVVIAVKPVFQCPDDTEEQKTVKRNLIIEWRQQILEKNQRYLDLSESDWRSVEIANLKRSKRWLVIPKHTLPRCSRTALRVTASDRSTLPTHTWITLVPQKAQIVAKLQANSQRVGLEDTVVLNAGASYDPDTVTAKKDFEYSWSCVRQWPVEQKQLEEPCNISAIDGSLFGASSKFKFTPDAVDMRASTVYLLMVVVRAGIGNVSNPSTACYDKVRSSSANVTLEISGRTTLPALSVAVCTEFPCDCLSTNTQTKFNPNTNVILRACSDVAMVSHKWTPKSVPAIQGAEIIPRSAVEKKQLQPTVTVVLLEPTVLSAKLSEPYTFVLRATFVSPHGDARSNTHKLKLQLNYPPQDGSLAVENTNQLVQTLPVSGVPSKDLFKITAPNWYDDDGPLTYSFFTIDKCTSSESFLNNRIPTASSITTQLRYDPGGSCSVGTKQRVIVAGTVTDQLGATTELCTNENSCPLVALSPMADLDPDDLFKQLERRQNEETPSQEVTDDYVFAVQTLQKHIKESQPDVKSATPTEKQAKQISTALEVLKDTAASTLEEITPDTAVVQGQLLKSVAAVVLAGPINDNLAETALNATKSMIGDMEVARNSGQVQRIVEATTNVFRGVSRHSSSSTTTDAIKVKSHLKRGAGDFCDTLTNTSAHTTLPVGSASNGFLFSCQKVVQRQRDAIDEENGQVEIVLAGATSLPGTNDNTFSALPLRVTTTQATSVSRPPMTFRAVHLQDQSESQISGSRRLSTTDCGSLPVSDLRLTTELSLDPRVSLHVTHRVDIPLHSCECDKCSARDTVGDVVLPQGKRPSLVLSHITLVGGVILQKYYKVSAHVNDAVVAPGAITKAGSEAKIAQASYKQVSRKQILELGIKERQKQPLDRVIEINSLMDPNQSWNVEKFSPVYFLVISSIGVVLLSFSSFTILAVCNEHRRKASLEQHEQKAEMFIKEGYINYCILPENLAKNPSMGNLLLFTFETYHIAFSTILTFVPFGCTGCGNLRKILRVEMPAAVRLSLFLIQILNYMWIEAIFVNSREVDSMSCLLGVVCLDSAWIIRRCSAALFGSLLHVPAMRIIPRMFRYTLQLRSNTRHTEEVSGGIFEPALTYLFHHTKRTYKESTSSRNLNIVVPSMKQKKTLVVPLSTVPAIDSSKINFGDKSTKIGLAKIVPENILTTDPVKPFMAPPQTINAPSRNTSRSARRKLEHTKRLRKLEHTKMLRAFELDTWDNDFYIQRLRMTQLIICWVTVFVFAAIPTGFSVVYAHTFSDHISVKWMQGWAIDIALNVVVIETVFVLVSFYAAWIYVKLCRCRKKNATPFRKKITLLRDTISFRSLGSRKTKENTT